MAMAGVVALAPETGSQQNVSRVHTLQLRFSSLCPSSSDLEHREKTVVLLETDEVDMIWRINSPLHMLNRCSTFLVSILCIKATSTVRMGVFNEEAILNSFCSIARLVLGGDTAVGISSQSNRDSDR